jgi:2'-5' RNA ligase
MKAEAVSLPGYRVYDYMIIMTPHEELRNRISEIRGQFNKEFEVKNPQAAGKPNMMLASFTQYEMMEDRIINRLRGIAMGYPPFKVEVKNYGSFPSHTIYIDVTSKLPVQSLVKTIRTEAQRLMKFDDENKPYFSLEPHFTIARKLKPWQYEKGWLKYSNFSFRGTFIADEMTLLKKSREAKNWVVVKRFEFKNMPVNTKQGELFG